MPFVMDVGLGVFLVNGYSRNKNLLGCQRGIRVALRGEE